MWRSLVEDVGDERLAREMVVSGAIAAGIWERRGLDEFTLAALEQRPEDDPVEALTLVLDPGDLWSVFESAATYETLAELDDDLADEAYELVWEATIAEHARRPREPWHERRLAELVARLRTHLPLANRPQASACLAHACDEFERSADVRERLAALLLEDSFDRLGINPALAA